VQQPRSDEALELSRGWQPGNDERKGTKKEVHVDVRFPPFFSGMDGIGRFLCFSCDHFLLSKGVNSNQILRISNPMFFLRSSSNPKEPLGLIWNRGMKKHMNRKNSGI
jgi:hypothetical protein